MQSQIVTVTVGGCGTSSWCRHGQGGGGGGVTMLGSVATGQSTSVLMPEHALVTATFPKACAAPVLTLEVPSESLVVSALFTRTLSPLEFRVSSPATSISMSMPLI